MSRLFQRQCFVNCEGTVFDGLRTAFKFDGNLEKYPNEGQIVLYNLSENSRTAFQKKGSRVELNVGYDNNSFLLFSGDIRFCDNKRDGADWVTTVHLGDGERAFLYSRLALSLRPGAKESDQVAKLKEEITKSGIAFSPEEAKKLTDAMKSKNLIGGLTEAVKAIPKLAQLAAKHGLNASVQNGAVKITPARPRRSDFPSGLGELLSPDTGLVGSPEYSEKEKKHKKSVIVKAKCLLRPLKCGDAIVLRSENINGDFYIKSITHSGDTFGGDWYTYMELLSLS